ncbi:hypothetical protein BCR34DRAFT_607256 [Clohesyomyces aquaticus]|uniref:Uncharacterized protein n=1 Tax=Clohesyomyces aquaticus TaxID=1231657 RepID=A0A1Y1YHL6_9PLEO|nr:hypothetical protein BCR34DRAFT_607256 [Clohesyomyces aquaticus]
MKLAAFLAAVVTADLAAGASALASSPNSPLNRIAESRTHRIDKRWDLPQPAGDWEWYLALCKGENLIDAIRETDQEAVLRFQRPPPEMTVQSKFHDFPDEFGHWGWSYYNGARINAKNGDFDHTGWGISDALQGMKVSDKIVGEGSDGKNHVAWVHHGPAWGDGDDPDYLHHDVKGKTYKVEGKTYKYTDAYYQLGINDEGGVILSLNLKAPEYIDGPKDWPKSELPQLRRASDIMYGLWKTYRESKPLNTLRYIMAVQITNEPTKALIVRAIGEDNIAPWPGTFVGIGESGNLRDEGIALLGAPISQPIAYMLIQHKEEFGGLRIVGVRVFLSSDTIRKACMLWYLKPAAPATPGARGVPDDQV